MQGDAMAHRSKSEAGKDRQWEGPLFVSLAITEPKRTAQRPQKTSNQSVESMSCLGAAPKQAAATLAPMAGVAWEACGSAADLLLF